MTSKFSQAQDTQTLPPVCRSATIMLPTWQMEPHHPITGIVQFHMRLLGGDYLDGCDYIILNWNQPLTRWVGGTAKPDYTTGVHIRPGVPGQPMIVDFHASAAAGGEYIYGWTAPNYSHPTPWQSGDHRGTGLPPGNWTWQTFYQLL